MPNLKAPPSHLAVVALAHSKKDFQGMWGWWWLIFLFLLHCHSILKQRLE